MVFERRNRIAWVYQVILTPCMSGCFIEVGKNWLLAFFWSMLVLTWRESGSIEKHNGFCPPSQNPLCFTGRRDCVTGTCKTQWILPRGPESGVFFQLIQNTPSSHIDFGLQANFLFFFRFFWMCGADRLVLVVNDECLSDSVLRGGHFLAFFPDFVAPLSWNRWSSKCRLPLNVFSLFFWLVLWWEY